MLTYAHLDRVWTTHPRTEMPVNILPDSTTEQLNTFIGTVADRVDDEGSERWANGEGPYCFEETEERVNGSFSEAVKSCSRKACAMNISLAGVALGESSLARFEISCPNRNFVSKSIAEQEEEECFEAQRLTIDGLLPWIQYQNKLKH